MSSEGRVVLEVEVIVGTYDGLLIGLVYDMLEEKGKMCSKFQEKAHVGSVRSLAASSAGVLASGGSDEVIKLYNMRRHTEVGTLMQHEGTINCLEFHQDKHLFSASDDGSICLWSTHDWECVHHMTGHSGPVRSVAVHPSGKLALSAGKDKTVRTWDLSSGKCAYIKRLSRAAEIILWSPIGDKYLTTFNNFFALFSVQSNAIIQQVTVGHHINSVVFIKDDVLAVGSESHDIRLYSTDTGEIIETLKGHTNRVKSLIFVSGTNLLFSGSSDGTIRVWNIATDNLADSCCVSQYLLSGERLTSMTISYPEELEQLPRKKRRIKKSEQQTTHSTDEVQTVAIPSSTSEEIVKRDKLASVTFQEEDKIKTGKKRKTRKRKRTSDCPPRPVVSVEYEEEEESKKTTISKRTECQQEQSTVICTKKLKTKKKKN